jgi:hypothetical protein
VLRVIFGPKGEEVTEDYGILHNELKKVYFSPDVMVQYSVIQKDVFNFVSLYFKIRTSDKYNVN